MTVEGSGAQTIQPAALDARALWADVVRQRLVLPPRIVRKDGLDHLDFSHPVSKRDARQVQVRVYGASAVPDSPDRFCGRVSLLASASKMNAWGWNLPAGPESLGGSCPGAVPAFPMLDVTDAQRRAMLTPDALRAPIRPPVFLCSGCYAIKGRYASALLQIVLAARYQFTRWCLARPDGTSLFARYMIHAIESGMAKSVLRLRKLEAAGRGGEAWKVHHPAFYRLHDSGDLFSHAYAQAWFEIARAFTIPRVVPIRGGAIRIPAVTFWAPTRVWCVKKALRTGACPQTLDMSCAPPNFILRPSALHFGEGAPHLSSPGYAAGTASGALGPSTSLAAWTCPAYLPPHEGGGAEPHAQVKGRWIKGCCARSIGPGYNAGVTTDARAPRGHGCRACWTNPELSVAYQEH